jgi:predicted nucleic acid-binding protein
VSYLLDTCVLSELIKPKPSAKVAAWIEGCDEQSLFLSVITIGELEKGIAKLPDSAKRARLELWARRDLVQRFQDRILPIDAAVAARWGSLSGAAETKGRPLPVIDSLIAATGLHHDLDVVTRNTEDFKQCGVRCLDPWIDLRTVIPTDYRSLACRRLQVTKYELNRLGNCSMRCSTSCIHAVEGRQACPEPSRRERQAA